MQLDPDELRIIGQDAHGLPPADRAMIIHAADELEKTARLLVATQGVLIESQQHRIALMERVNELQKPRQMTLSYLYGYGYAKL